jgi:hypothetical protein
MFGRHLRLHTTGGSCPECKGDSDAEGGSSQGAAFSYRLALITALDEHGLPITARGEAFEVIGRDEQWLPVNCYATLTLRLLDDGRELRIVNVQLALAQRSA